MNPSEFIKALMAGSGTESAEFTGGRAMIPEQVGQPVIDVTENIALQDVVRSLMAALNTGEVIGAQAAIQFLEKQGMTEDQSRSIVREIKYFTEEEL